MDRRPDAGRLLLLSIAVLAVGASASAPAQAAQVAVHARLPEQQGALQVTVTPGGGAPEAAATPSPAGGAPMLSGTVEIITPTPLPESARTPVPGTRKNPAQTGETVETTYQGATFLVTLREVITGDRAAELVAPGNPSEQLQEGQEYLLFYTVARIVSVPGEEAVHVGSYLWSLVDASGEIHESNFLFGPSPSFTGQGYEGATIDGWSVFARNVGEPIFLVFGLSIEGTGGAWFAVPKEPPPATVITPARAEAPSEPTP